MESNDSPEIPDRGETSDIPGLPSGVGTEKCVRCACAVDDIQIFYAAYASHTVVYLNHVELVTASTELNCT